MSRTAPRRRARTPLTALTAIAVLALTAACGSDDAGGAGSAPEGPVLVVSDPWVRATDGAQDQSMTAAFMQLDNDGDETVTVTGASSPVAGTVELHEVVDEDGTNVMREATGGLEIPAGGGQLLQPGGFHVMLMDLSGPLAAGDEVELTLELSDGTSETVTAPVKAFTEEGGHYHAPGTGEHSHGDDDSHGDDGKDDGTEHEKDDHAHDEGDDHS